MIEVTYRSSKETLRRKIDELKEELGQIDSMLSCLPNPPQHWGAGVHLSPATRLGLWFQRNGKDAR